MGVRADQASKDFPGGIVGQGLRFGRVNIHFALSTFMENRMSPMILSNPRFFQDISGIPALGVALS